MDKTSVLILAAILAVGCDQQGYEDQFERMIPGCEFAPEELEASCLGVTLLWEGRDQDSAKVVREGCAVADCPEGNCGDRPGRCSLGTLRDDDGEGRTWFVWVVKVKGLEDVRPRLFEEWEALQKPADQ